MDTLGETLDSLSFPDCVWGMVYLEDKDEFLVGASRPGSGEARRLCLFETISYRRPEPRLKNIQSMIHHGRLVRQRIRGERRPPTHLGQLTCPAAVGKEIACITPPSGVQLFSLESYRWTNKPPLLSMATSVAVSLNRNLVVQTEYSIQIFSSDVLESGKVRNGARLPHVYSLGKKYILCVLQPNRRLTLLESGKLQLRLDDTTFPRSLLPNQPSSDYAPSCSGLVVKFDISAAMRAWQLGTSLPAPVEAGDEDTLSLYGLSPTWTKMVKVHNSTLQMLRVNDVEHGTILAVLEDDDLGSGEVYDITFGLGAESSFYLKIDGPGQHIQLPFDITASPSGQYSHTITKGEPMPLSEPRATPPYTLDANCEWVLNAKSRKVCWISPGNLRRGAGGHFWDGLSLVMVGDDGIVRKVSSKYLVC